MNSEKDNIKSASDFVNSIVETMTEKRMWVWSDGNYGGVQKTQSGCEPKLYICPYCDEEWQSWNQFQQIGSERRDSIECEVCKKDPERRRRKENEKRAIIEAEEKNKRRNENYQKNMAPRYKGVGTPINKELLSCTCSLIYGLFGVGKTWEAHSVIKELHNNKKIDNFKFTSEIALLTDLKNDFDSLERKVNYYKNIDLLIVDEFAKSNESDFNKAHMFDILNHRYMWMKKTILICNAKDKEELKIMVPTAILDRFRENLVFMKGQSKRYQNGN